MVNCNGRLSESRLRQNETLDDASNQLALSRHRVIHDCNFRSSSGDVATSRPSSNFNPSAFSTIACARRFDRATIPSRFNPKTARSNVSSTDCISLKLDLTCSQRTCTPKALSRCGIRLLKRTPSWSSNGPLCRCRMHARYTIGASLNGILIPYRQSIRCGWLKSTEFPAPSASAYDILGQL